MTQTVTMMTLSNLMLNYLSSLVRFAQGYWLLFIG
jgi:hypothetical protein